MKKSHVVIHCSATPDQGTLDWAAIRRWHVYNNGWREIGYHLGIETYGDMYQVLLGRPIDMDGAHCREMDMNRHALGVCFVGDYDTAGPPEAMLQLMANQLRPIMQLLGIPANAEHVHPHREYATWKTCPGAQFPMAHFVNLLR